MTGDQVYFVDEYEAFRQRVDVAFAGLAFGRQVQHSDFVLYEDVVEEKVAIPPPPLEPAPRNRAERRKRWHDMRRRKRK